MITSHINAYLNAAAPFTPASYGSVRAWYDADQQTEAANAEVETLVDRTGNGWNFSGTEGPLLRHNNLNGKKVLEAGVGGTADRLVAAFTLLSGLTQASYFMVCKGRADPSVSPRDHAPLQTNPQGGNCHFFSDGNWYENFFSSVRRSVNPPTSWASWRIAAVTSKASEYKMYWDGTQILTTGTNTIRNVDDSRTMFDHNAGVAGHYDGYLAELIILSTVPTTADRQKFEGYLAHKYGLQANLPGGHPYASSPPTV